LQVDALLRYVRDGGTLVLTDNTAEFNEWREKWRVNPLLPARQEGRGRIVYIPKVVPGIAHLDKAAGNQDPEPGAMPRPGVQINPSQWVLPSNHREIHQAIVRSLPHELSLTISTSLTTVLEILNRPETHETMVHFVNFDPNSKPAPIEVSMRTQFPGRVASVTCLSPDADDPVVLAFQEKEGRVNFTVPAVRLYSLVVLAYQ